MQPLTLPQSALSIPIYSMPQTQSSVPYQIPLQQSPNTSNGWKLFDNHHHYAIPSQQPQQTPLSAVSAPYNPYRHSNIVHNNYDQQTYYTHPQEMNPSQSQAAHSMNNNIIDPYTYTQMQYQLQLQQLLQQQQQQQYQSQTVAAPQHQPQQQQTESISQFNTKSETTSSGQEMKETGQRPACIEKIFLNAKFVTTAVFDHLSKEIPHLSPHEVYEGFFVTTNQTGNEWDMILKIFYKNEQENKTYIKYYLVHQDFCLRGNRCSDLFINELSRNEGCIEIELELTLNLFNEFDHVISYIYGHDIYIGDSHLISLYVLMERLKINGGILEELYHEIKKFCDKYHCVSYLLKSEELSCEELIWLCGDSILQNLSTISYYEWLSIPITAFHRLIFQAVSGGIGGKYSDFIVCELIMQYIKAIMSESHSNAKEIVRHLEAADITSVSIDHCLPLIKICDVLFCDEPQLWRLNNITIYRLSVHKLSIEFTPYHRELCQQLQGLNPITFSQILVYAKHLQPNALTLSLMAYKEGNHAAYFNDKHLKISNILRERKVSEENDHEEDEKCGKKNEKHQPEQKQSVDSEMNLNHNQNQMKVEEEEEEEGSDVVEEDEVSKQEEEDKIIGDYISLESSVDHHPVIISPLEIASNCDTNNCSRSPGKSLDDHNYSRSPVYSMNSENYRWSPCSLSHHNKDEKELNGDGNSNKNGDAFIYETPLSKRSNIMTDALISRLTK